eukprot:6193246-Pleurochrysis_carterae.AAC.3
MHPVVHASSRAFVPLCVRPVSACADLCVCALVHARLTDVAIAEQAGLERVRDDETRVAAYERNAQRDEQRARGRLDAARQHEVVA